MPSARPQDYINRYIWMKIMILYVVWGLSKKEDLNLILSRGRVHFMRLGSKEVLKRVGLV